MANVAIYDLDGTPQAVISYLESVNTPDYEGRPDVVINPSIPVGVAIKYLKHVTGSIVEMTQEEKDAVDAAEVAAFLARLKSNAKSLYDGQQEQGQALRALVYVLIDEINILRQWTISFKSETALASSLADFKTRVATLPTLPDRTLAQAKTAIQTEIDNGTVDE